MYFQSKYLFNCFKYLIFNWFILFPTEFLFSKADVPNKQTLIIITNPTTIPRPNEIISIKRILLKPDREERFASAWQQNKSCISQQIDAEGDGNWDELLLEVSLPANTTDTLKIIWTARNPFRSKTTNVQLSLRSDSDKPSPEMQTAYRSRGFTQNIAKPFYQMEGPGIENDKVAFRAFFDYRNGKDIYGKIMDTLVLERVGVGGSWHNLQPWGMDILRVGNSLGAGGLAVEEGGILYRLGDADSAYFNALYEGPLQAAFALRFKAWDVAAEKKNGSETVSIAKGDFFYRNNVTVDLNKRQTLVTGFPNFMSLPVVYKKHNAAFSSISIYGGQAEGTGTKLGLAILFSTQDFVGHQTTDTTAKISNTSYVRLKGGKKTYTLYFVAGWEKTDSRFSTQRGFEDYLQQTAVRLAYPVQLKIFNQKV